MTSGEEITWRQAGGAYYAEAGGRIVALLYWYGDEGHYLHGADEGSEPTQAGWFVVMVDEPDDHRSVQAPAPIPGEELAELRESTRAVLEAATPLVAACLDAARRS